MMVLNTHYSDAVYKNAQHKLMKLKDNNYLFEI